jgi:hypothetical protein
VAETTYVMTVELAISGDAEAMAGVRELLASEEVRERISIETASTLRMELANELEEDTPAEIEVVWLWPPQEET